MEQKILFITTGKINKDSEPKMVYVKCKNGSLWYLNNLNDKFSTSVRESNLYDLSEEDKVNEMYLELKDRLSKFNKSPYISHETLEEHFDKLMFIQDEINKGLSDYENFDGIDFCDVSAGGIQVRTSHKDIKGYTYGNQITINYDFSNYLDVPTQVVEMWKYFDTPEKVRSQQRFIADGERWGWD